MKEKICAIFDIGRASKRLLIFNERFEQLDKQTVSIENSVDEDGCIIEGMESAIDSLFEAKQDKLLNCAKYIPH